MPLTQPLATRLLTWGRLSACARHSCLAGAGGPEGAPAGRWSFAGLKAGRGLKGRPTREASRYPRGLE
jgi:hypothetical protein